MLLPQGLCIPCSFCLEPSSPRCPQDFLLSFKICAQMSPHLNRDMSSYPARTFNVPYPALVFSRAFLTTNNLCNLLLMPVVFPSPRMSVSSPPGQHSESTVCMKKEQSLPLPPCNFSRGSQLHALKGAETSSFKTALPASLLLDEGSTFFSSCFSFANSLSPKCNPSVSIPLEV